jgi:hypothetical protein
LLTVAVINDENTNDENTNDENELCLICMEEINDDRCRVCPIRHKYHNRCYDFQEVDTENCKLCFTPLSPCNGNYKNERESIYTSPQHTSPQRQLRDPNNHTIIDVGDEISHELDDAISDIRKPAIVDINQLEQDNRINEQDDDTIPAIVEATDEEKNFLKFMLSFVLFSRRPYDEDFEGQNGGFNKRTIKKKKNKKNKKNTKNNYY